MALTSPNLPVTLDSGLLLELDLAYRRLCGQFSISSLPLC
jgi:hypothetical protein